MLHHRPVSPDEGACCGRSQIQTAAAFGLSGNSFDTATDRSLSPAWRSDPPGRAAEDLQDVCRLKLGMLRSDRAQLAWAFGQEGEGALHRVGKLLRCPAP